VWESVEANRATAVLSCNNSGKTWLAARIVVKFILDHWRQGVRVVTTAPTAAQVALLLWQEIRAAYARSRARLGPEKVPGKIIGSPYPQWKIGDLVAGFGRKPADHEQSAMQGVHAAFVLAVLDEAGGVAQQIWDAVDKITTNEGARVLAIGNPDDRTAPFGKVTAPGSGWTVIRIDGLRTPNFNRELIETGPYPLTRALMRHEGIPYNDEPVPAGLPGHGPAAPPAPAVGRGAVHPLVRPATGNRGPDGPEAVGAAGRRPRRRLATVHRGRPRRLPRQRWRVGDPARLVPARHRTVG
jgi:hypothetical protein